MKKLVLTLAAVPLAAVAVEASAQTYADTGGTVAVQNRIANLEERFDAGSRAGVFTTAERNSISRQLSELRNLERRYSYNGLSQAEQRTLQQRIRTVRDQLRLAGGPNWARNYGWSEAELDAHGSAYGRVGSYDSYGRPISSSGETYDRYGRATADNRIVYDRYGRPIDDNGVVYDRHGRPVADNSVVYDRYGRPLPHRGVVTDRYGRPVADNGVVYDRYGRPVDGGYAGQGGPYEPVPRSSRGGNVLGGVLGSVLGGGGGMGGILGSILGRGGLRRGDVITSAIGSVLGSAVGFGSQFRDTSNAYYRSDGERVYEIDARSNRINRVHPVRR